MCVIFKYSLQVNTSNMNVFNVSNIRSRVSVGPIDFKYVGINGTFHELVCRGSGAVVYHGNTFH